MENEINNQIDNINENIVEETVSTEIETDDFAMQNYNKKIEKQKSKKSKKINLIMFLINICIVIVIFVYNLTQNDNFTPLSNLSFNFNFLAIIILIIGLTTFLDSIITNIFIKTATGTSNLKLGYKSFSIMRYYDSITPMGAGGQPFMTTYLIDKNIPGSKALAIPVKKFLIQQFAWLIITFFGLIYALVNKSIQSPLILIFSTIGFVMNFGLAVFFLLGSSSEKITRGIAVWGLKLLTKLKIIKNYDKALTKTINFMKEYQVIMKEFSSNKKRFILTLFIGLIKNAIYFTIPFLIYCCFSEFNMDLFITFFTFTIIVELSASCFPLPGGSGMNEITFSVLFSTYLPNAVFWALLLWRFFSYYILILQGIAIMAIDLIPKKNKSKITNS